ncbi:sodium-coupled monocarboxylate transporter 1 [Nephila pilipes]|uniref:Sodium-coupled monocarboxylate transporter 1 n=1 Tax=Nephila pilipes TaxID=299642 RepID=A0A8X6R2R2_NEPPI|nr:sodium-coupled monocarboxylate transporter 1 [Nephila pilipes]GFU16367.1 sodium-coupled monocarboxylate transporter 1 [Nephila pilipes]GFU45513.1 sodium-coupled monocarboxylate transporter 1 [Nephila pilipes]
MSSKQHLGFADTAVIGVSLIIPALIGLKFRFSGGRQRTTNEYFLAGKDASMFPVIMSLSVTILSASAMLGLPSEIYKFGCQFLLVGFSTGIGMLLSSRIFLPVYFECKVSSIYEYLEMRFGKYTKYTVSGMFIIQMVLYTSSVLLGPVLALTAVTDFSIEMMIISSGAVCTFYCFLVSRCDVISCYKKVKKLFLFFAIIIQLGSQNLYMYSL